MGVGMGVGIPSSDPHPHPRGTHTHDPCGLPIPMQYPTISIYSTLFLTSDGHGSMFNLYYVLLPLEWTNTLFLTLAEHGSTSNIYHVILPLVYVALSFSHWPGMDLHSSLTMLY